eukprot:CAMPEP_0206411080 /NCGR_PEP_ID=MMETSP0294-20121207/33018_1 /ASSEMBLY_ACC=CAM_ASM_000327 /TAXON_ID=39354 /ORGANISM="Heterosigma akashiwo, Strain CCMP2393" /LENGTH=32 /DNA_ID= /DNA_START= /DNA_END= /DNA_ORIENTATION=
MKWGLTATSNDVHSAIAEVSSPRFGIKETGSK